MLIGQNEKPFRELFLVGLDIIQDGDDIRILEMQHLFESSFKEATKLTGFSPVEELLKSVLQIFPDWKIKPPTSSEVIREDEILNSKQGAAINSYINGGIVALCKDKWLFNSICNENETLKKYTPATIITSLNTVDGLVDYQIMQEKFYLFKPRNLAGGKGIKQFQGITSQKKLNAFINAQPCINDGKVHPKFRSSLLFMIQEYLHDKINGSVFSKPVIRVYAAIVWDGTNPLAPRMLISLAANAATNSNRICHELNDFTLINNQSYPCNIKDIAKPLKKFLATFFKHLLDGQEKIYYRHWEILAKKYNKQHATLPLAQRLNLLEQFIEAVIIEQPLTNNKLSYYQCFVLQALINNLPKMDKSIGILKLNLLVAFAKILKNNFHPYAEDRFYPLHTVFNEFNTKIEDFKMDQVGEYGEIARNHLKPVAPILPFTYPPRVSYLDYCAKAEIDAVSAVSSLSLRAVATFARR